MLTQFMSRLFQRVRFLFSLHGLALFALTFLASALLLFNDRAVGRAQPLSQERDANTYLFYSLWGGGGVGNGQFATPKGIAFDNANGWVYVADEFNNRVQKFDKQGNYILQWGGLKRPYGIAVAPNGTVYVTNTKKNQVRQYDSSGTFLNQWGNKGAGNSQFNKPTGIAIDKKGNVYVADTDNRRIQKFQANGTFIAKWSSAAAASPNALSYPYGIAVDGKLNVYVADTSYHRIVKYDKNGNFIKAWGKEGSKNGQFKFPRTLAIDAAKNLYVADADNNRIQKFDANGKFLGKFGSSGAGNGQFIKPYGVAVEASGDYVYVADTSNNRVQKFVREGVITPTPTSTVPSPTPTVPSPTPTVPSPTPTVPSPTPTVPSPTPTATLTMFGNGSDGDLTVFGTTFYADDVRSGLSTSSAGTTLNVSSTAGFAAGQEVLVLQTRGSGAGQYEFAKIASLGSGVLNLQARLQNAYVQDSTSRAQVISVRHYNNVTVQNGGTITANAWDGTSGGIVVFRVKGTTNVQIGGTISVAGDGFRGGDGSSTIPDTAYQGESPSGLGVKSTSRNGGGGGGISVPAPAAHSGSGGAGHATEGSGGTVGDGGTPGEGGITYGNSTLSSVLFGSGSGGAYGNVGANGGGVIVIFSKSLTVTGTLDAAGISGHAIGAPDHANGATGGASGGSILVKAQTVTVGTNLITATGGEAGIGYSPSGNGGTGGDGRIRIEYCDSISGTTNPTASTQQITCQ